MIDGSVSSLWPDELTNKRKRNLSMLLNGFDLSVIHIYFSGVFFLFPEKSLLLGTTT